MIRALVFAGLVLVGLADAISNNLPQRPTPSSEWSWDYSTMASYATDQQPSETPDPASETNVPLESYSSPSNAISSTSEVWYQPPSVSTSSISPRIEYSTYTRVQTITWTRSHSTTITSVVIETSITTLTTTATQTEEGSTTTTEIASGLCPTASDDAEAYGYGCSPSLSETSSTSAKTTAPVVSSHPYSQPEVHTSSSKPTTTDPGGSYPPVVTGGAAAKAVDFGAIGVLAGLLVAMV